MVITQPKIDRFSIRNHRWKAENELYHFQALYKGTVRLLEWIWYMYDHKYMYNEQCPD